LVERTRIVPALTLEAALAVQLEPAALVVVHCKSPVPAVQTSELVLGITSKISQVVVAPEYDQILMLGVHADGATTVTKPFNVTCCSAPPGRFQVAEPLFPPMERGIPVGAAPVP
jgi:hypothetical protein